jgi:hypothetical protein
VWRSQTDPVARINYLTFQVDLLNDQLYTVTISGEFCSAYCEGYNMSYNFDLTTWSLLTLDTLLSKIGQEELLKQLTDFKNKLIREKINQIKQIELSDTLDEAELE